MAEVVRNAFGLKSVLLTESMPPTSRKQRKAIDQKLKKYPHVRCYALERGRNGSADRIGIIINVLARKIIC